MSRELGEFLRTRRARIKPTDVGLLAGPRRRVPGLRRDEVAGLAGVSVEYYVRLEQGRTAGVSDSVLDAVARALRLDESEHDHLRNLVRPSTPLRGPNPVRAAVLTMLDLMESVPALVMSTRLDVLAYNRLMDVIAGFSSMPPGERNMARLVFLDPQAREQYPTWDNVAAETVAYLRLNAGRQPDDTNLAALVDELSERSEEFRGLWASHDVRDKTYGRKRVIHHLVGELDLNWESLVLPGDVGQLLVTYVPTPGSATAEKLAVLASWTVPRGTTAEPSRIS